MGKGGCSLAGSRLDIGPRGTMTTGMASATATVTITDTDRDMDRGMGMGTVIPVQGRARIVWRTDTGRVGRMRKTRTPAATAMGKEGEREREKEGVRIGGMGMGAPLRVPAVEAAAEGEADTIRRTARIIGGSRCLP